MGVRLPRDRLKLLRWATATGHIAVTRKDRGSDFGVSFPACPNLADQKQLLELLGAEAIGVTLSEEDMLDPEQSTSAIIVHHPQAKYFSV